MPETALITRVPEAESYIARYRDRYDPSARRNVPAHVTILYPFMAPTLVTAEVLERLRAVAEKLLRGGDYVDLLHEYVREYPAAGYGGTFITWAAHKRREPYNSWGNGSAMRVSPVGVLFLAAAVC